MQIKVFKPILILSTLIFFYLDHNPVWSQVKTKEESPLIWANKFGGFVSDKPNVDSALFCLQKVAASTQFPFLLKELIHDGFAQTFLESEYDSEQERNESFERRRLGIALLSSVMQDTSRVLRELVRPVYFLVQVQEARNNESKLAVLANNFITSQLGTIDIYKNYAGRYGLMIYEIVSGKPALKPVAEKMMSSIYLNLKNHQIVADLSMSGAEQGKRAWYRYLFAFSNYVKAGKTTDLRKKETYLKMAADHSPDITDKNHLSSYFYDQVFLGMKNKKGFEEEYLQFLVSHAEYKAKALPVLLRMALTNPEHKEKLEEMYIETDKSGISFKEFWLTSINNIATPAPDILLTTTDKISFSSQALRGKWIFLDFWGTWCQPCREEHPGLQQFYTELSQKQSESLTVMTVACNDTDDKVNAYMKEKKFSFPVAMADNKIQEQYNLVGYPTKILITPQGNYLTVPFGADWRKYVAKYADL